MADPANHPALTAPAAISPQGADASAPPRRRRSLPSGRWTVIAKLLQTTAFKLSLAYLVIFAAGAGLVLTSLGYNVRTLIDEQIAQTVDAEITGLSEQYSQGGIRQLVETIDRRARQPGSSLYLVTTFAGEAITGNVAQLPAGVLQTPGLTETTYQRVGEKVASHHAVARIFLLPAGFRLLVGRDLEDRDTLWRVMNAALLTSLAWLVVIGTVGGLVVATRVLRRVDAMNASAVGIMNGDLTQRLPVSGSGDELDRLAQNLNAMLERIAALMQGLKEVSDNIAHDLKTPLTRLRNGVEGALRIADDPQLYRSALERVLEESDQLIGVFNALLMIARLEAGSGPEIMTTFDAVPVVRDVVDLYEPLAEEAGLSIETMTDAALLLRGSRELVGQMLANLIDNAIKYGVPDDALLTAGTISVEAHRKGDHIEISVADHGRGIAEADRERVVERFVRLEQSRSRPGSGLGLSLVSAVARLHGATLDMSDNAPGLRATVVFPAGGPGAGPPERLQPIQERA